jgi:putative N6-adenine-specific DNA methylase
VESLFAACAPGLESVLAYELTELGLLKPAPFKPPRDASPPGLEFPGGIRELYAANLGSRVAERVLLRAAPFRAPGFHELVSGTAALPWERWVAPGRPLAVRVESRRSRLYHEKAVAERIAQGVGRRLKTAPPPLVKAGPDGADGAQLVFTRLDGDLCVLSVDSSGAPLHRRGWRQATAKAPLKETLAAALLLASRWDRRSPLLDPFCGAGTIPIEAALMAAGIPPGAGRRFAFQDWPSFDPALWESVRAASARPPADPFPVILGSDRDAGAVEAARGNAERAGVAGRVRFDCLPLSAASPPREPGWLVANPPYGVRVSEGKDLRDLYAALGNFARAKCPGWRMAVMCADARLLSMTDFSFDRSLSTLNGGIPVRLALWRP